MRRWPQLAEVKAQHLSENKPKVPIWKPSVPSLTCIDMLQTFQIAYGIASGAGCVMPHASRPKVLAQKVAKCVPDTSGRSVTQLCLGVGQPLVFVCPKLIRERICTNFWTKHGAAGTLYAMSDSG